MISDPMSSDRSASVGDATQAGAIGLGIVASVAGAILAAPVTAVIGAAAGTVGLVALWQARRLRRGALVDEGITERLGEEVPDAWSRVNQDEDLAALVLEALDASMLSHSEDQARALGRVVADALKANPVLTVDAASVLLDTMRGMGVHHFKALQFLADNSEPNGRAYMPQVAAAIGADEDTASAVVSALSARGMTQPLGAITWNSVTSYGLKVLSYIR